MGRRRYPLVVALLVLAGCSGSTASAPSSTEPAESVESAVEAVGDDDDGNVESNSEVVSIEESTSTSTAAETVSDEPDEMSSVAPVVPAGDPVPPDPDASDTTAWLSRRSMSASAIELIWSAGVTSAECSLHRFAYAEERPDASAMTADNRIHTSPHLEGEPNIFLDSDVTEGEKYQYGVICLDSAGAVSSVGWSRLDAVTDEEPPSPVEVSLDVEDGVVMMTWSEPEENYELHAYQIHRSVGGQEPEVIATTWNLDQRSFVDDDPPEGVTSYGVSSYDFHFNNSEPTMIAVDLS